MNSSISSSEKDPRRIAGAWLSLFFCAFLVLLIVFIVFNAVLLSRPKARFDVEERRLTACKIFSPDRYDMVLSGSSRINFGIDPASMQPFLPGMRIYNCAMFGGAVNREILDYLEDRKIDWNAPGDKIVLLEFSPRAMFSCLRKNGSYRSMLSKSPDEIRSLLNYSAARRFSLDNLFLPVSRERWNMRGAPDPGTVPYCHVDTGWYEVVNISEDPRDGLEKRLRNGKRDALYPERYVIDRSLEEILERTREWRARGVLVFGVEPPIAPELRQLEERLSRYDRSEAVSRFEKAGGIFIPVTGKYQVTLGGSHLDSSEAKKFSVEIAEKIARCLQEAHRGGQGHGRHRRAYPAEGRGTAGTDRGPGGRGRSPHDGAGSGIPDRGQQDR